MRRRFRSLSLVLLVVGVGLATVRPAAAASILLNGGFETGTFADWTTTPSPFASLFGVNTQDPHSGQFAAFFGGVDGGDGEEDTIAQTLATTPGQSYLVSFWLEMDIPGGCSLPTDNCAETDFAALWNGAPLVSVVSPPTFLYTEYSFITQATGPTSTFTFRAANVPGDYRLDDVSVTPVPEPLSGVLVGSGLVALLARRRRWKI